jgi:hypothetical protein
VKSDHNVFGIVLLVIGLLFFAAGIATFVENYPRYASAEIVAYGILLVAAGGMVLILGRGNLRGSSDRQEGLEAPSRPSGMKEPGSSRVVLGTTPLLQGACSVFRNNNFQQIVILSLSYNADSDLFKMYSGDTLYANFPASSLIGVAKYSSKKQFLSVPIPGVSTYYMGLSVRYGPQENWAYVYSFNDESAANSSKAAVQSCLPEGQILVLLKTRERVSLTEVASVLAKRHRSSSTDDARKAIESLIMSGDVNGVIDGEGFVGTSALQRESPQREFVRSETITREIIKVPCRYCGTMNNLASDKFCSGCGASVK